MSTEMKRKRLLRSLAKQGETQLLVDLQPKGANHYYLAKENQYRTFDRFPPSHLPFRRPSTALVSYQGSRLIGHIYGLSANMEIVINRNKHMKKGNRPNRIVEIKSTSQKRKASTVYKDSNTTPLGNAFVSSSELSSFNDGDNSSRQTSSSSSASLPLEQKHHSKSSPHPVTRYTKNRASITVSHDRQQAKSVVSESLPTVCTDENANANAHMLPINVRQSRSHQAMQQSTSTNDSNKTHNSSSKTTHRINSLSISGIKQDGCGNSGGGNGGGSTRSDQSADEDSRLSQLQIHERLTSKACPPALHHYSNLTPSQAQPGATSQPLVSPSVPVSRRKQLKSQISSSRPSQSKQKAEIDPKYADPIVGATPSFQSRLAELASLEAETVRWERLRKLKKKSRDD